MSLDVSLMIKQPVVAFTNNITHNLSEMAHQVVLDNDITLREVLWHPEEHNLRFAKDISELLNEAFNILLSNPYHYREFNPPNGWGNYDNLVDFVYNYRNACWDNPEAEIMVSRWLNYLYQSYLCASPTTVVSCKASSCLKQKQRAECPLRNSLQLS